MRCLLCDYQTNEKKNIKQHYIKSHDINEKNVFFKKVINQKNNCFFGRKCSYCKEYVLSNKAAHDFLKHYGKGLSIDDNGDPNGNLDKPLKIMRIVDFKKMEITFKEHSSFYDFYDSVAVVDSFLAQVKNAIKSDSDFIIRAGFSIENIQQPLDNYSEPLLQTTYWSTKPIQTKSLNDFVLFNLRGDILRRVINNKLSGSSWYFNKFNYINVKILDASNQLMR